jgi:hypothetical protein
VALACPIDEAIWTDWVTEQVMKSYPVLTEEVS